MSLAWLCRIGELSEYISDEEVDMMLLQTRYMRVERAEPYLRLFGSHR
jgi:hypothetical protein